MDAHDIALVRISEEAQLCTGKLDLTGLNLDCLPQEVSGLKHLRALDCSGTKVADLLPLAGLSALQGLDCSLTKVTDLSPLAGLSALQTLHCSHTNVADLSPLAGLSTLQTLHCSNTIVTDLSPLAGLSALKALGCCNPLVTDLSPLAGLSALQTLDCSLIKVADLLPLAGLSALQTLHCAGIKVTNLSPLAGLSALQVLVCSGTYVTNLSPLAGLSALQVLVCSGTDVADLSPLAGLSALQEVNCSSTDVADLSPLAGLSALQEVNCSGTDVADLSPLAGLSALQVLVCSGTDVADLSPLAGLSALQTLDCSHTYVADLLPLAGLSALQTLLCSGTDVTDLSPLAGLSALKALGCSGTDVADLSPLAGLSALQTLDCSHTKVTDLLPLAGLSALQAFHCSECRLLSLPIEVLTLPKLTTLVLYKTTVSGMPPIGVLSQSEYDNCLERVHAHFADLAAGEEEEGSSVKLLLLGNGGAGKTQIARWLAGASFDADWNSTHGIEVGDVALPGEPEVRLQVWDFGGQDIYHGTHALFLTGPAVLMVVWAEDTEARESHECGGLTFRDHPLPYWIDVARHQGHPASPLLIAQSKCDRPEQERRRFPLPDVVVDALPAWCKMLHLSAREGRGGAALAEALRDAVTWLRDPQRLGVPRVGAVRARVRRRLESLRDADRALPPDRRRNRLLSMAEFETICADEGGVASPAHLLTWLDAEGAVLHRPGLFEDHIVLDQNWALEAIYAVFERRGALIEIRRAGGRFTRSLLGRLVWHEHGAAEQELFLSMMRSCGICFPHRRFRDEAGEEIEYIAPDLLPERSAVAGRLADRWDEDRPGEQAVLRYPLLHGGLIRTVMARIGEAAGPDGLYWKGGLGGREASTGSRLRIEQLMTGPWQGEIHVQTQGGRAAELLDRLVDLVGEAHSRVGLHPAATERTSLATPTSEEKTMVFVQEKPALPEWYVSYAWGDGTPEGRAREEVVDRLCAAATARGRRILRDKEVLGLGDSISGFMRRIGAGDHVFVILSDKYLRSPHCMFELSEVWRNSRQEGRAFLDRVCVFALPDARIWTSSDRIGWAVHWKRQHDELDALSRQHGATILGETGSAELRLMQRFYTQVQDILATLTDIVQPRTFEELEQFGFDENCRSNREIVS